MLYLEDRLPKKRLIVAGILDEFSYQCFKYECDLITFDPENWQRILEKDKPDMLFVESAWKGNNGTWQYKIGKYYNQNRNELTQLIGWCREQKIPTVFWNKEDPVYFDKFIDAAKLFDYVFTTDKDCVEKYKKILGHNNVDVLTFAAQPRIHNPIKETQYKKEKLCFAGSFYANRHEERKKDLEDLLDVASGYGLDIYDRNFSVNEDVTNTTFKYPERFQAYIHGGLPYNETAKAYKGYKIMLNANSVKSSPTMFSRRVFEILACGTPVISTYAQGIENIFGSDLVFMGNSKDDYEKSINKLMSDIGFYEKVCIRGIRETLDSHTYSHRLKAVAKKIGLQVTDDFQPKVSVISIVKDHNEFLTVFKNYKRQRYGNKEMIIIFPHIGMIKKLDSNIPYFERGFTKHSISKKDLGKCLSNLCTGEFISFFDSCNYYGMYYLTDLMNGRKYADCKVIGKSCNFIYNTDSKELDVVSGENEFVYVLKMSISACIIEKKLFEKIQSKNKINCIKEMEIFSKDLNTEQRIFSIDKYNFIKEFYINSLTGKKEEELCQKINI